MVGVRSWEVEVLNTYIHTYVRTCEAGRCDGDRGGYSWIACMYGHCSRSD